MTIKPDYQALFYASPYPYLVLALDLTIIGANEAYLRSTNRTEAELLGQYVFDAFPMDPGDPDSTNTQEVKASLETAIATGRPNATSFLRYAIPHKGGSGTVFNERYWSTVHTPVFGDDGKVAFVFQNAIDVTHLYKLDKMSKRVSIDMKPPADEDTSNFSRAQMHQALVRIVNDERGHLRNLFNQSPGFVAVLTGPNHVFEMVNEAFYQLAGHREVVGRSLWDALPEVANQGYEELLDQVYRTGEPWSGRGIKLSVQPEPDGPLLARYLDLSYQPYYGEDGSIVGVFAQGYDVTESVEAQLARRESEQRLHEGMVAAKMLVWDWDIASRKVVFSDNVLEVLGCTLDHVDGLYEFIHPVDRKRMAAVHERAIEGRSGYRDIVRFTRPDNGKVIWLDVHGKIRFDSAGKPSAFRGVTLDISERIQAEEELRLADRRKDEFLAMLAHELRNPLAPISSAAQLMKLAPLDESTLKKTSDIIMRQINHMTALVDDLIDVSRVTRGLIATDKIPLDVKRIIADAVEQAIPLIEGKRHHLRVDLAPQTALVLGDQKRLVQVLVNMLNNAARYTPEGGSIDLCLAVDAEHVSFDVIDNGIGISAELLPRVFDLFTQAERASDRSQGGLGVGLALVRSIAELHGGTVSATSGGLSKGSKFTIRLPRHHLSQQGAGNAAVREDSNVAAPPLQILIVDDNEDAASMLSLFLKAAGHQVSIVHSARAALEHVKTAVPEIFLLDIGLPEMDGNQLARLLRSDSKTRKSLLVAVTGYGREQDMEQSSAAGFDHHLVKPVAADKLLALLARHCAMLAGVAV